MKERIHCFILDNRIKHNIRKVCRKQFFYYVKHFVKNKKEFKMSLFDIIKQSRGIAKEISERELRARATHDACIGIRY